MSPKFAGIVATAALLTLIGCAGETLVPNEATDPGSPISLTPDGSCSSYSNQDIEGELIGSLYDGTTRICLPSSTNNAYRLELSFVNGGGYLSGYDPVFYLVDHLNDRDYHLHWNDVHSTDPDGCDATFGTMSERHTGSLEGQESHCIAPGRYFLTMFQGATQVKQVELDYVHPASNFGMQQAEIRPDVWESGRTVRVVDETFAVPGYVATDHIVHFNIGSAVSPVTPTEILEADAPGSDTFLLNWSPMPNSDLVVATDEVLRVDVGRTLAPGLAQGQFAALHRITWESGVRTGWFTSTTGNNHTRAHTYGGSPRCVTLRHEVAYPSDITSNGIVVPAARQFDRTVDVGGGCAGRTHPDLVPGTIAAQGTLPSNGAGSVNVTVQNTGTGSSIAGTVNVYYSTTSTFPTGTAPIGQASVPVIANGGSTVVTVPVQMVNAGSGTRYLHAVVDAGRTSAELHEANNRGFASTLVGDLPDLVMTSVPTPLNRSAGSAVQFDVSFANIGSGVAATGWKGSVVLSPDQTYDATDVRLTTFTPAAALQPLNQMGSTGIQSVFFNIPAGTTPGTYYVVGFADTLNVIGEGNEGNNALASRAIAVTAAGQLPDVVIDSVTMPLGNSGEAGANGVWAVLHIRNAGNATAPGGWTARLYRSSNNTCCSGDVIQWTKVVSTTLAPGATATVSVKFNLPGSAGTFYWIGELDASTGGFVQELQESNKANNVKATATTFIIEPL